MSHGMTMWLPHASYEEDTWQVEREREDKSEMKIFY